MTRTEKRDGRRPADTLSAQQAHARCLQRIGAGRAPRTATRPADGARDAAADARRRRPRSVAAGANATRAAGAEVA
jgi:hypothetical protein